MGKVVLVTGVSRMVGGLTARALSRHPQVSKVIAVDVVPPTHSIGTARFVRADIRNPIIGKVIRQEGVDTVVHLGVIMTPRHAGGRVAQKEINVIGTMQLLAACQKAESLQRLVVKSSGVVYGASPRDPALFTEDMVAKRLPSGGIARDSVEVENYVRGFARRRPDVEVSMLRMANLAGPGLSTALTEYFSMRLLPVPFGFDGRMQLLHLDDAVAALVQATVGPAAGIVNVAGEGVITVRQAARLAKRPTVPLAPGLPGVTARASRLTGIGAFDPSQLPWMCFGRVMDTTRMREQLEFTPGRSTVEVVREVFGSTAHFPPSLGSVVTGLQGVLR